ncbi:MAG TPA: hypothetical protein VGI19_03005 [Candidatus Cybelea sp.]
MKLLAKAAATALAGSLLLAAPGLGDSPASIDVHVAPYYNSAGPVINVGKYSSGLASKVPGEFVATIVRMKRQWSTLNFVELYVGAIRLYDLAYRNEAAYWFYTAQLRGAQFNALVDPNRIGGAGSRAFELSRAHDAFSKHVTADIGGWAFGDVDTLETIVRQIQDENATVPPMQEMYPGVAFVHRSQWAQKNAPIEADLEHFRNHLATNKAQIAKERAQNGTAAHFAGLTSRRFPGGF